MPMPSNVYTLFIPGSTHAVLWSVKTELTTLLDRSPVLSFYELTLASVSAEFQKLWSIAIMARRHGPRENLMGGPKRELTSR